MSGGRTLRRIRRVNIFLLITTSLNALAAGYSFMVDSDGSGLGISPGYLRHTPFHDFLIPGIVLFTIIGIGCLLTSMTVIRKERFYPHCMMVQGILLGGWILIQSYMLREFNLLHLIFILTGVFLAGSGYLILRKKLL